MSYRFDDTLRERLARHLTAHPRQRHTDPALRRAAVVLIAADAGDGSAALLLTLRPMGMRRHANQFAFPGGRLDEGETATQAALRETREEINLELAPDMLLGRLDDFPTRSGFVITPLVAWAPGKLELIANPEEVARIHHIRLHDLELPGSPQFVTIPESDRPVIRYPLVDTLIHAPTAALMYQFMEVAVHGRETRVAHLEQPVWAWR